MNEYMIVRVKGSDEVDVPVLIYGEENGFTNQIIELGGGKVMVSVKLEGAETRTVNLENTNDTHPMEVIINVYP